MGKDEGRRLKVWTWDGRDPVSLHDLAFVTAAYAKSELQAATVRLRLPKPKGGDYALLKPSDPRHDMAVSSPGRVFFRDVDATERWVDEEELASVRRASTARHLQAGAAVTPLHRPER